MGLLPQPHTHRICPAAPARLPSLQEQERVAQLQQQLMSMMRERAEEKARHQAAQAQWLHFQQQQARLVQQVQQQWRGGAGGVRAHQRLVDPMETWLEETMSQLELPPAPELAAQAWHQQVSAPPAVAAHAPPAQLQRQPAAGPAAERPLQCAAAAPGGRLERQKHTTGNELADALAALLLPS